MELDELDGCLCGSIIDLWVLVKASFSDEEGKDWLHVLLLDEPGNELEDLGDGNSVNSIVTNQTHLHFLILIVVILCGLEAQLLNDVPLFIIELD